jgi:hypothetical protein
MEVEKGEKAINHRWALLLVTIYRFIKNIHFKSQRHLCIASNQLLMFKKGNTYICLYNPHGRDVSNKIRYQTLFCNFYLALYKF